MVHRLVDDKSLKGWPHFMKKLKIKCLTIYENLFAIENLNGNKFYVLDWAAVYTVNPGKPQYKNVHVNTP